ncbi:MAG: hypothetical protein BTN85_0971 [Candidatus Methanohalarchaeum thermophilum]|uniref:Uncharacterized protein n=1 Tax=Methanohalarchaeum thermophilum TaxID=1903181 RepID=A0A1Q6DVS5_METT1|nr:MAG: hypothetical protein BTN85_0971 [Candidatus Methanohalarchaeum thermophilum]
MIVCIREAGDGKIKLLWIKGTSGKTFLLEKM